MQVQPHSLIVGGTRGIGHAVASVLAAEGHIVSVIGRTVPEDVNPAVSYWKADLAKEKLLSAVLTKIISQNGALNNLVCLQRFKGDGDKWRGEIETSLSATKFLIERLADSFGRHASNSIVLVSSAASRVVADEQPVGYHVAKAGIDQMARYYAVVLGPKRIRVNVVAPGTVLKAENKEFYLNNKRLQRLFQRIVPLGRMGTADEVANVIAFLCSSKASFVTGQTILVDGGVNLHSVETLARKLKE